MATPNAEEVASYAISFGLQKGFEYVEAYVEENNSIVYSIEQGKPGGAGVAKISGIRVRVIVDGSLYTFSTNDINKKAIERAFAFKKFYGNITKLSAEKTEHAMYKAKEKIKIEDSYQNFFSDLSEIDRRLADKKVKYRSIYGGMGRSLSYLLNSDGTEIRSNIPFISSFMSFIVGDNEKSRQRLVEIGSTGGYELFDFDKTISRIDGEVSAMNNVLSKGINLSKGELSKIKNIVVSPEIVGIAAHESVGHPSEADRVFGREAAQAGTSYITNNFNMKIGSEKVTIIDDPTISNSYGFFLYDDEGVKARKKVLVDKGMQNELLLNREYAYSLNTKSNASARSDSFSNEPIIRMSNTYLEKGDSNLEELISEAKNGIYIKNFTEWNIDDTRSFARYQGNEAYLIKNGRLDQPIKNFMLDISSTDFWGSIDLVGDEFELFPGDCGKGEPMQGVPVTMGGASALLRLR
ncbi:MAG: TldD/PmbA family protein [Candidatus Micrarchaeia archaeon]